MKTFGLIASTAALLPVVTHGFMFPAGQPLARPSRPIRHASRTSTKMQAGPGAGDQPMTYAERLRAAQAARAAAGAGGGGGGGGQPPASPSRPAPPTQSPGRMRHGEEPAMAEPEIPFSPDVYEEIRMAIKIITARLQREKPLSRDEFERFEAAVATIVEDALSGQELPATPAAPVPPAAAAYTAPPESNVVSSPVLRRTADDIVNEGPAWDPSQKSYGLPTGTQNTYALEGMEAMTPAEYQEALRKRVSARARAVRDTKSYGNIVSNDYLRYLNKNPKSDDVEAMREQAKKKGHEDFRRYQ
ncbi:unnamed protein product [Sphacelaria rigidula]